MTLKIVLALLLRIASKAVQKGIERKSTKSAKFLLVNALTDMLLAMIGNRATTTKKLQGYGN